MASDLGSRESQTHGVTRRGFLAGVGAGTAGSVILPTGTSAQQDERRDSADSTRPIQPDLRSLPPFAEASQAVQQALLEMGAPGGLLDAKDPLHEGPTRLITNPELSPNNKDNSAHTAGVTFLGQFLDHDMTFDAASRLGVPTPPEALHQLRERRRSISIRCTGRADMRASSSTTRRPRQVQGGKRRRVRRSAAASERHGHHRRSAERRKPHHRGASRRDAAVPQPRRGHAAGRGRGSTGSRPRPPRPAPSRKSANGTASAASSSRRAGWSPGTTSGSSSTSSCRRSSARPWSAKSWSAGRASTRRSRRAQSIPVEFQGAAYRFGHSLVRPSYRANMAGNGGQPFFGFIFDPAGEGQPDPVDLPRRGPGAPTLHRLADLLRLRRRPGDQRAPEQDDRHEDLDAAVQPSARAPSPAGTRRPRCPAQPSPPSDLVASRQARPSRRPCGFRRWPRPS